MSDTVCIFAIQSTRFQRPDFQIGQVTSDTSEDLTSSNTEIGEAFAYAPAGEFTVLPSWITLTNTFKHFEANGLIKLYDHPPSQERAAIEVAAAKAEAEVASRRRKAIIDTEVQAANAATKKVVIKPTPGPDLGLTPPAPPIK